MKVYIRFRPTDGEMIDHKVSYLSSSSSSPKGSSKSPKPDPTPPLPQSLTLKLLEHSPTFTFSSGGVLPSNCEQESVYKQCAEDAAGMVSEGIASCIFAYGQTGSGKTFTMTGGSQYEDRGLIPRSISTIFQKLSKREGQTKVFISYVEIYQEGCYDLLDQDKRLKKLEEWDKVKTKEDSNGDLIFEGLRVYECEAEEAALSLLFLGNMNRITSSTKMNEASSRSHAIFTITATVTNGKKVETGKLHIVDLAGSERSGKTTDLVSTFKLKDSFTPAPRRKSESVDINLSLHYLQRVVGALQMHSPHVPYRNSMMTQYLKVSREGTLRYAIPAVLIHAFLTCLLPTLTLFLTPSILAPIVAGLARGQLEHNIHRDCVPGAFQLERVPKYSQVLGQVRAGGGQVR